MGFDPRHIGIAAKRPLALAGDFGESDYYFATDTHVLSFYTPSGWLDFSAVAVSGDASTTTVGQVEVRTAPGGAHPVALTTDDLNVASGVSPLDGASLVPLANLGGITHTQLAAAAAIAGTQLATALTLTDGSSINTGATTGLKIGTATSQKVGFFNSAPVVQPTVTGSRGANAALASLLTALAALGLVVDSSS